MGGRYGEVKNKQKGPVRRRAVLGRALYPEFFSEGTRLRSVNGGKSFISEERFIREKYTLLLRALPKGPRKKSVKGGKALYPGSVISEFHIPKAPILPET